MKYEINIGSKVRVIVGSAVGILIEKPKDTDKFTYYVIQLLNPITYYGNIYDKLYLLEGEFMPVKINLK